MAKAKWDAETVIKRILALEDLGEDLTCSHIKEIDSALVGASISYFGNWGSALEAAGLDYSEIRKISKLRRKEKVRKWSENKVLEEIREVAKTEPDISYAYMKEKHSSLVAAASNYVGSWKKALEEIGFDYSEVQRKGREARIERETMWYKDLLVERLEKLGVRDSATLKAQNPAFYKILMDHFKSWARVMKHKNRDKDSSSEDNSGSK
jgi:hypothetical protein